MRRHIVILKTILAIFFPGSLYPQANNISDGVIIKENQVTEKEQKFIRFYFEAEKHKLSEEYKGAIENYKECISVLPTEPSPHYQIGRIEFYFFQNLDNAKNHIEQAIQLNPQNEWYYYELLAIYGVENNPKKQQGVYEELIKIKPENQDYYLSSIQLLIVLEDFRKAEKTIRKAEKKFGTSIDLLLELKNMYLSQNKKDQAEKVAQELVKKSSIFYNDLAEVYMYFSDYENAIKTYIKLLKTYPNNASAIVALYKIYSNKKDIENQEKYLFKIAKSQSINIETKKEIFYNIVLNNEFNKYSNFKKIIQESSRLNPDEPLFNLILGDVSAKEEDYLNAKKYYQKSLYSGIIKDDYIYNKLIEIYWSENEFGEILNISNVALERFPLSPMFYYYKALALSMTGQHDLCITTLLTGKEYVFDNDLLLSDFYSLIGDNYHKLENDTASDEAYTAALKHNPNNTFVLNNYSYYLSNREENLFLAKEMIIKCVELTESTPNSSFLDTYGWVLYKLKEYQLAKEQIEKALLLNNNSAVIYEHYGDVLLELGFVGEAVLAWQKAHQINKNTDLEEKIKIHTQ